MIFIFVTIFQIEILLIKRICWF